MHSFKSLFTSAAALLAFAFIHAGSLHAVDNVTVTVTLTISHEVALVWSDNVGGNTATDKAWAMGTVALDSVYTDSLSNTYVTNTSNTGLLMDVDVTSGNSASWSLGAARNADTFTVEVAPDGSTWTHLSPASNGNNYINDLAAGSTTAADYEFRFGTPSSLTAGAGVQQTVVITFTGEADGTD